MKKFLTFILILAMVLSVSSFAMAEEVTSLNGSGTEDAPYIISNLDELKFFRNSVNAGDTTYNAKNVVVKLGANIDLAGENWTPIGNVTDFKAANVYKGVFDGGNYTISNLSINDTSGNTDVVCLGLFGVVRPATTNDFGVKNLTINNVSITSAGTKVGALAGETYQCKLENITITGDINISGNHYVAGAVGSLAYSSATNLDVKGTSNDGGKITATGRLVGGVYGWCAEGGRTYQDCDVENMTISGNGMVGGIGGLVHYNNIIKNCTVKNVDIVLTGTNPGQMQGYGEIVGCLVNDANGSTVTGVTVTDVTITDYDGSNITDAPEVGAVYSKSGQAVQAKIGDKYYSTLTHAVNAAVKSSGSDPVTLLADAEPIEIPEGVVLDTTSEYDGLVAEVTTPDGKTMTVAGEDNIEEAANSQTGVTVKPISGKGNLELDTSKGNQVVITNAMKDKVTINGQALEPQASDAPQDIPSRPQTPAKPASSGIKVKYNGGNSFSTSKSAVPTSVEIDGVPVSFSGNGKNFTVSCINPGAKWVTVRWNSTTVTVNFTPDAAAECTTVAIPKTGDMPLWAAIAAFFGF